MTCSTSQNYFYNTQCISLELEIDKHIVVQDWKVDDIWMRCMVMTHKAGRVLIREAPKRPIVTLEEQQRFTAQVEKSI